MSVVSDSPTVEFVRGHMEAWGNHDLEAARRNVAEGVEFFGNDVHTVGIDAYMEGLTYFTAAFDRGSLRIIAARGDDRWAMVMAEVTVAGRPWLSARILELDETGSKVTAERVIFTAPPTPPA